MTGADMGLTPLKAPDNPKKRLAIKPQAATFPGSASANVDHIPVPAPTAITPSAARVSMERGVRRRCSATESALATLAVIRAVVSPSPS